MKAFADKSVQAELFAFIGRQRGKKPADGVQVKVLFADEAKLASYTEEFGSPKFSQIGPIHNPRIGDNRPAGDPAGGFHFVQDCVQFRNLLRFIHARQNKGMTP